MRADEDIPAKAGLAGKAAAAVILTLVLANCSGSEKAPAPAGAANPIDETRLQDYFKTMDRDGDGFISRPEFEEERGAVFLAIDRNNSMTLTANEMHLTPEAFAKLSGGDAAVTPDEFSGSELATFEQIDASGDKQLSYQEVRDFVVKFGS
jgi:Ca2+-binding EF-hand superfamily protein